MTIALIAHGGAGKWRAGSDDDAVEGLRAAVGDRDVPVAMHRTRDMPHAFFSGGSVVVSRMRV